MDSSTHFSGKSVLVTAGSNGIGKAISGAFLDAGASVHVADIDESANRCFSDEFPQALVSHCDVSIESEVIDVVDRHLDQFSGIDIMVNCAGIAGPTGYVGEIAPEEWRHSIAVNLDAAFLFCNRVVPQMRSNGAGNIINIASTAGWHGYPLRSPYASAKWGLIGFTKSLAMEVGVAGIRVNAICPGSISGERMDRVIAAEAKSKNISEQQVRDKYTKSCSLRTFIDATDIADMAVFLASDSAARVTGQIMNVDGHLENFSGLDD